MSSKIVTGGFFGLKVYWSKPNKRPPLPAPEFSFVRDKEEMHRTVHLHACYMCTLLLGCTTRAYSASIKPTMLPRADDLLNRTAPILLFDSDVIQDRTLPARNASVGSTQTGSDPFTSHRVDLAQHRKNVMSFRNNLLEYSKTMGESSYEPELHSAEVDDGEYWECSCCHFADGWSKDAEYDLTGFVTVRLDDQERHACTPRADGLNFTCGTSTYECYASANRESCFVCPNVVALTIASPSPLP